MTQHGNRNKIFSFEISMKICFKNTAKPYQNQKKLKYEQVCCTYIPKTGYLHDKTKISKANLRVNYLMLKMLQKTIYLASPDLGQVTKFIPKIQNFKCA